MEKLVLIRNNKGYGIKDIETDRVIIPCMYGSEQVVLISEIIEISQGIYKLKGFKDEQEVYGIYNAFTNDFIDLNYSKIELKDGKIILYGKDSEEIYNPRVSMNETVATVTIGKQREIMPIYKEIMPGIYILSDYKNPSKIVGFYDSKNTKLVKETFTDYEIVNGTLVLKRKVKINKKIYGQDILRSKTYISIYDPKYEKYITGEQYYDEEIDEYVSDGYTYSGYNTINRECISANNGILILSGKALYDTINGFLKENVSCYFRDNKIELYSDNSDRLFLGYYDLIERVEKGYLTVESSEKKSTHNLYVSCAEPTNYVYVHYGIHPVQEFSDFFGVFTEKFTILFDKEYNVITKINKSLKITEFTPEMSKKFGINIENNKSAYLVDGKLCSFAKRIMQYPFVKKKTKPLPFMELPKSIIACVDYEYGIGTFATSSEIELDYELEQIDMNKNHISKKMEDMFYECEELQSEYPHLVKRRKPKK